MMIDLYRNWRSIENLPILGSTSIRTLLPKENIYQKDIPILRSEKFVIPRSRWAEIQDAQIPDSYAKASVVESYFCVCIYVLRRSGMLSVAAQQSVEKTKTIEHSSSLRNSLSQTERLDLALNGGGYGKAGSLMANVGVAFELSNVTEYASEDRRSEMVDIRYDSCMDDRDIVFWDVAKVIVLYRTLKNSEPEPLTRLVALDDFYYETYQKTYTYHEEGN